MLLARRCARVALTRRHAWPRCISSDFGARDGTPIANKSAVLGAVDDALGVGRPPDLEVLLTEHLTDVSTPFSEAVHAGLLRYGHVAVRYTTSDGAQRVMNILGGVEGADMVNFVDPSDYVYGTRGWETYAQQGGAYNRDFVGLRVERCSPGAVDAMHAFFQALDVRTKIDDAGGAARFQLVEARLGALADQVPPPFGDALRRGLDGVRRSTEFLSRGDDAHDADDLLARGRRVVGDVRRARWTAGNCAQWTSAGVVFAGLLKRRRLFPKAILIELLESEYLRHGRPDNVHVVVYKHVAHAPPYMPKYRPLRPSYVHPLNPVRNHVYGNMEAFADVVVEVPAGSDAAVVSRNPSPRRPPRWMPYWRAAVIGGPTLVLVGAVDHIGPMGPMAAAIWLGANWWLH